MIPGTFIPPTADRGPALLIDRTAGTNRGNMTNQSGLAAAFDGVTNQPAMFSAEGSGNGNVSWIGKTLALPTAVDRVVVYGASDQGYISGANNTITINLRGKNGTAPTGKTDGTIIGTTGAFTDTSTTNSKIIDVADKLTKWDHVFLDFVQSTGDKSCCAEMQIYGWQV